MQKNHRLFSGYGVYIIYANYKEKQLTFNFASLLQTVCSLQSLLSCLLRKDCCQNLLSLVFSFPCYLLGFCMLAAIITYLAAKL